jgi:putative transcriptional regulator
MRTIRVIEPEEYSPAAIRKLRRSMELSQAAFASLLGVSSVLVQFWERGTRRPAPIARRLLDQVSEHPEDFVKLLQPMSMARHRQSGSRPHKQRLAS